MIITNQEEWKLFQLYNTSYYGQTIMRFAQRWANEIEKRVEPNKKLSVFTIDNCYNLANLKEGITRNQTLASIEVLKKCWKYGNVLEEWLYEFSTHNNFNSDNSRAGEYVAPSFTISEQSDS